MKIFTSLIFILLIFLSCAQQPGALTEKFQSIINSRWSFLQDQSVVFNSIPLIAQGRDYSCGAAALSAILYYFGDDFREAQLETLLQTSHDGTSYQKMKDFILETLNNPEKKKKAFLTQGKGEKPDDPEAEVPAHADLETPYAVEVFSGKSKVPTTKPLRRDLGEKWVPEDGLTLTELETFLRKKMPVLVAFQAWVPSIRKDVEWENNWKDGHYAVVVGYDQENLFFMDPWLKGTWGKINKKEFLSRWHDSDAEVDSVEVNHLALVVSRNVPTFEFFKGALPLLE